MRSLAFYIGLALLVLAASAGVAHILAALLQPAGGRVSIGSIWAGLDANSLVGFQGLIENRVSPALWTPVQAYLVWPAWLTLGLPGLLLVLLFRPRRRPFN